MKSVVYSAAELGFDRSWISTAALQVIDGLRAGGFEAHLVGGCVRDLLLHRRPKDFDITTNASPEQIRRLFRNARIIGRRFKLVHVRFGREVIEVATHRAAGQTSARGRVVDDNVFGTVEEDAARRDFTINALYYEPVSETVIDYLGGVADVRDATLRMIGEPRARFTEDPVRMLRALRFRAKLEVTLADNLAPAIAECAAMLEEVPAARLFDEMLKFFHHGHALRGWRELRAHHLARRLFPLTASTEDEDARLIDIALQNTDQRVREGKPVIAAFLFAVLLWRAFGREVARHRANMPPQDAAWLAGEAVFARQSRTVAVPRRVSGAAIEIWAMQHRLEAKRRKSVPGLLADRRFRAGYDFLLLRRKIGEVDARLADWWTEVQQSPQAEAARLAHIAAKKSRRPPGHSANRAGAVR